MSRDRRYEDHEIRAILELAVRDEQARPRPLPAADGLTLAQLQEVGREVGLSAERLERAVAEFEGRGVGVARTATLGLPTGVGYTVPLGRVPTEHEWELLIAELRTTFGVKGEVTGHGGLREWSHGNLHAFLEPTDGGGHRLRLTDSMEPALGGFVVGGAFLLLALMILVVLLGKEDPGFRFIVPAVFSVVGAASIAVTTTTLIGWDRERQAQLEHIGERARLIVGGREADPAAAERRALSGDTEGRELPPG